MNKIAEKAVGSAGAAVRALNPHLFGRQPVAASARPCVDGKRLRQASGSKLNKTEAEFLALLKAHTPEVATVHAQSVTFEIANGCRYTPDFVVFYPLGQVNAYEVKGFFRDDAAVKLKVAARTFPFVKWTLAWKKKGGWQSQEIKP